MSNQRKPKPGRFLVHTPHGTLDQYNTAELDQINKVQYAGQLIDEVAHVSMRSDSPEAAAGRNVIADGINGFNSRPRQPFLGWCSAGHFRRSLKRLLKAANAEQFSVGLRQ